MTRLGIFFTDFFRDLDLSNGTILIGGIRSMDDLQMDKQRLTAYDFAGCVRNISINGHTIDPQTVNKSSGVSVGCRRTGGCKGTPCGKFGVCHDTWDSHECACASNYRAQSCKYGKL